MHMGHGMDNEAPERLWVKDGHDSWGAYGNWYEDGTGGGIEYVRADLHAALLADNANLREALMEVAETNGGNPIERNSRMKKIARQSATGDA